jgi:hypothetical protein
MTGKVKYLTPNEIIDTLQHSNYPSIITEGDDDVIVWRRFEDIFAQANITIIPAGGRSQLLQVFERRGELPPSAVVIFIADLDHWSLSLIPPSYVDERLIFTRGYSIENDMFLDGELHRLLTSSEKLRFDLELNTMVEWYALAASRYRQGENPCFDVHPNQMLDDAVTASAMTAVRPGELYPSELRSHIYSNASRLLRGKCLFALLARQLKGYTYRALLNFGASRCGPCFKRIEVTIAAYLTSQGCL